MYNKRICATKIKQPFITCLGVVASCAAVVSGSAWAESPVNVINAEAAKAPIVTVSLRGNISVLEGSGGNIGVLDGPDGKFMVDAGIAVSKPRILEALNKISASPVKYVIDTHWHWDHTDGNAWLHSAGATIASTPNAAKYMTTTSRVDDWDFTFAPVAKGGEPSVMITKPKTFTFNGQNIIVTPVKPAHTDGDMFVYFEKSDVMFMGDLYWNGVYPFIDNKHGGNIGGAIDAVDTALKVVTDNTQVVPGHGEVSGRKELVEFRDMLAGIRDNVKALKQNP
jgi:glyoxylase-like metal-dependent hydrolase (beta-lactamase superfamily II)